MTVDRGGIDYPITVKAKGFDNLTIFKKSLDDIKKEMKEVQKLQAGGGRAASGTASKKAQTNAKKLTDLQKARLQIQKQQALLNSKTLQTQKTRLARQQQLVNSERQLALLKNPSLNKLKRELAVERSIQAVKVQRAKLENSSLRTATRQLTIDKQIASFQEKQAKFAALAAFAREKGLAGNAQALSDLGISRSRAQGLGLLEQDAPKKIDNTSKRASALTRTMKGLNSMVNRVQSSFLRLFTALAFFAVSRKILELFKNLVTSMVTFNAQLEQAKLGIASLFLAAGFVVNAQGEMVQGAEALAAAQKIAVAQTVQLRREALKTAATFDDLVQAYQTAIAPGLGAGLSADQVREFTVRISQAATAIGLPQNQLAEEIRSILQGTIQSRTTRIATSLGITNEDIANAKEAGRLFDFLQEQFGAFKVAGEEALNTFGALFTNLKDALLLVAGEAGLGFFESIKDVLRDLRDELVVIDKLTGAISPTPESLAAFRNLGDTLTGIVADFRNAFLGDNLGIITGALDLASSTLEVISGILIGILDTVKIIGIAIRPITELLRLFGANSKALGRVLGLLIGAAVALKLVPWGLVIAGLTALSGKAASAAVGFKILVGSLAGMAIPIAAVVAALAVMLITLGKVKDSFSDIEKEIGGDASFLETIQVVAITMGAVLDKLLIRISSFAGTVKLRFEQAFIAIQSLATETVLAIVNIISDAITDIIDSLLKKFPALGTILGIKEGDVKDTLKVLTDGLRDAADTAVKGLARVDKALLRVQKNLKKNLDAVDTSASARILALQTAGGRNAGKQGAGTKAGSAAALKTFLESATGAVVGKPNLDFDALAKGFTKSLDKASKELDLAKLNLPPQTLQVRKVQLQESLKLLDAQKKVQQEILSLESASLERQKRIAIEREKLNKSTKELVDDLVEVGPDSKAAERVLADTQLSNAAKQEAAKLAGEIVQAGNQEIAGQLRKNALLEAGTDLERDSNNLTNLRLLKLGEEFRIKSEIAKKDAEIAASKTRLETQRAAGGISREDFDVKAVGLEKESSEIRIAELERLAAASEDKSLEQQKYNAELDAELAKLEAINVQLEKAKVIAEGGAEAVIMGLSEGWNQFINDLPNGFEVALTGIQTVLNQVASAISDTLTRALDPSQGSIKDRWKKFFLDLSNTVLNTILKSFINDFLKEIFAAEAKASAGKAAGSFIKSVLGFAKGGYVQGFAEGGTVNSHPPLANKDPRDTVPAWLRPGEYVVRPEIVRKLGVGFFEGINSGIVNPLLGLDGLSGLRKSSARRAKTMSFATGGAVPAGGFAPAEPTILPVMIADENTMEQLINNGQSAFRKGIQDNQDAIAISGPRADRGGRF